MSLAHEILFGTVENVDRMIQAGADVEEVDEYGYTPLIEAAIANRVEMAQILLEYGAEINKSDVTGRTALHWAADNNNLPLCELLLANKADPNAYTTGGQPILIYPLLRKQTELKKLLYQGKASLDFAQDYINTKLLGHRYELVGQVDIVTAEERFIEIDYEGFFLEFTLDVVRNSLERYRNHFSARHLRTYFNYLHEIITSFANAIELMKFQRYTIDIKQYATQINAYLNQELLLLPVAYEGHAISFIKYKNLLVRCDRGENSKREGTVVVYQIGNPQRWTAEFVKQLIYKRQSREFVVDGIKDFLGLVTVETLPVEAQLIGNCSWANIEASIPAMLFLLQLQTSNAARDIQIYKGAALDFYREWTQWDKDRSLEECIHSFKTANKARKASKAAILGAILFQKCSYQVPKDLEKAEKIVEILTHPDYQYVIRSYVRVYWKDRQTREGKNLVQLLDDNGVKVEF